MTDYQPIACDLHSQYELAIMQRRRLWLSWQDAQQATHTDMVSPLDLYTRAGAEFLRVRDQEDRIQDIRLDRITHWELVPHGQDS